MRRQEEAVCDLAVRASIGDEPRDLGLGAGQGREADALTPGRDDPASHTEVGESATDAPRVPFGAKRQVQVERSPEDGDPALAIGPGEAPAEILERRSEGKPAGALLEESDRPFEILKPVLDQAADLGLDRSDRLHARIQLQSPSNRDERPGCQVAVAARSRDPSKVDLIGDIDREPRKEWPSVLQAR